MWKDTEYFRNKGELHRCAVFCLLQLGVEIYDTEMVLVDRTLTDICFENAVLFSEAGPDFLLKVELYRAGLGEDVGGSAPRKLASKLSSSLGRSAGRRLPAPNTTSWHTRCCPWQRCRMDSARTTSPSPATRRAPSGCRCMAACAAAWLHSPTAWLHR